MSILQRWAESPSPPDAIRIDIKFPFPFIGRTLGELLVDAGPSGVDL